MRIVRYQTGDSKKAKYGWLLGDKVGEIGGNVFGRYRRKEAETPLAEVKLVAPSEPSKIVCVGRNYIEHAKELGNEVPKVPLIFLKPPSSIIPDGETILLPTQSAQVEHEGELVVVMGKRGRYITAENAKKYILGYTIGNDVTARDLQRSDDQWTRAKGFDTFCPSRSLDSTPSSTPPAQCSPAASMDRCVKWPPPAIWYLTCRPCWRTSLL
jgi:2-keto-4-pentenoate hydratase/2-oxohepta-3-ene-1,7-dioic acid hydratase in catechol pathway